MTSADALSVARDAIIVALKLGAPAMLLALAVGLAISFFQALTQIQEMTLTFVPKMVIILLSLLLFLPFMLSTLTAFTESLMGRIVSGT
ncbi:MAG TPA: flagellar biosynthesis protein FliQ [Stellaceae bacterium]|jgi:flagellar biosynthetic protein FliQ|nr:flagellar biosynthesis protein FliQ [Stellaceae bacterium]HEX4192832.1 flagellar biosynthesis protein FliQ [Stellaceae bacterium]